MLLKKGETKLTVADIGLLSLVHEAPTAARYGHMLVRVSCIELNEIKKRFNYTLARPTYFCLGGPGGTVIEVWPAPAEDTEIKVRYYPAMKEV